MTSLSRKMWNGRRDRALSMIEVVVSITIVGVMMVAALNTVGASKLGQQKTGHRGKGALLAQQLMSEILQNAYADPEQPDSGIQIDSNENSDSRTDYDDVDDYDAWTASPPEYKDGTVIPDLNGWQRSVEVDWVSPNDLNTPIGDDESVKRIIVTVSRDGVPLASLTAVRTASGPIDRDP